MEAMMQNRQLRLWEGMTFEEALETSISSLIHYGSQYKHWTVSYSGGKDSSATVAFVLWAVQQGLVKRPETLTVIYADTRRELAPLQITAMNTLAQVEAMGFQTRIVLPPLDHRYWVYILGRGAIAPKKNARWCTEKLKVLPIFASLRDLRVSLGEKFLMLTGVRMGESAKRDQRIAVSCSKTTGECGQGWMQYAPEDAVADTLAPLLHWRLCYVWDWLYFGDQTGWMKNYAPHLFSHLFDIAAVYGGDEVRTGCVECDIVDEDKPLNNVLQTPEWAYLRPLKRLRTIRDEVMKPKNRLRRTTPNIKKDGTYGKKGQSIGAILLDARKRGLEQVLGVQNEINTYAIANNRPLVDLINAEEQARILELIEMKQFPDGWTGDEVHADELIEGRIAIGKHELAIQPLLFRE